MRCAFISKKERLKPFLFAVYKIASRIKFRINSAVQHHKIG